METLHQAIHKPEALIVPFIQISTEKPYRSELRPPWLAASQTSSGRIELCRNLVEQGIHESTDLTVGCCPIRPCMSVKGLLQVAFSRRKPMLFDKPIYLTLRPRQFDIDGKRSPQLAA